MSLFEDPRRSEIAAEEGAEATTADFEIESEPRRPIATQIVSVLLQALREIGETIIPAIVIAVAINLFLAQATQVLGKSMEPNLHTNQRVVVEKVTYPLLHGPRRGDVVVIELPGQQEMLIKRVIGLPGENLEVRGGEVYIDGEKIEETWTTRPSGGSYGPTTVPPLHVFVLGDNRGASNDSRSFGPVHIDHIVGQAWFSYWPPQHVGFVK